MLIVLATSPRVAPGLLSWPAWEALRSAAVVLAPPGHPQLPALDDAGIRYRLVDDVGLPAALGEPSDLARLLADATAEAAGPVVWLAQADADATGLPELPDLLAGLGPGRPRIVHGSADPCLALI